MKHLRLSVCIIALIFCSTAASEQQGACEGSKDADSRWSQLTVQHADAGVFTWDGFLSPEECDHLIAVASSRLSRSQVVAGGEGVEHNIRTSSGAAFSRGEDAVVKAISERIARWTLLPVLHQENPQVLSYTPGQQYRAHFDFFQDNSTVQNGGNRAATVVVYLNDVEEGGETVFALLPQKAAAAPGTQLSECASKGLAIKPKRGTALLFHNLTPEGKLEPRSLHAGCPVTKGSKFVYAQWIRAQPYTTMEEVMGRVADQQALTRIANLLAVAAPR